MRITITSASTKTGQATIRALLDISPRGTEIVGLYRNPQKAPAAFTSHGSFRAVQGDNSDPSTLDFRGSDAVLVVLPPVLDGSDPLAKAELISNGVKKVTEEAETVKKLVLLSSVGAEFEKGVGEIMTNNLSERILSETRVNHKIFARCAYFMENWTASLEGLRDPKPYFFSPVTPSDYKFPMVAVRDIGTSLAKDLISSAASLDAREPFIYDLEGPADHTPNDVQAAFSKALQKQVEIKLVQRQDLAGYFQQFIPEKTVPLYVEMTLGFLEGGIMAPNSPKRDKRGLVRGETTLDQVIRDAVSGM